MLFLDTDLQQSSGNTSHFQWKGRYIIKLIKIPEPSLPISEISETMGITLRKPNIMHIHSLLTMFMFIMLR